MLQKYSLNSYSYWLRQVVSEDLNIRFRRMFKGGISKIVIQLKDPGSHLKEDHVVKLLYIFESLFGFIPRMIKNKKSYRVGEYKYDEGFLTGIQMVLTKKEDVCAFISYLNECLLMDFEKEGGQIYVDNRQKFGLAVEIFYKAPQIKKRYSLFRILEKRFIVTNMLFTLTEEQSSVLSSLFISCSVKG